MLTVIWIYLVIGIIVVTVAFVAYEFFVPEKEKDIDLNDVPCLNIVIGFVICVLVWPLLFWSAYHDI